MKHGDEGTHHFCDFHQKLFKSKKNIKFPSLYILCCGCDPGKDCYYTDKRKKKK